jgi:hypothetical protein
MSPNKKNHHPCKSDFGSYVYFYLIAVALFLLPYFLDLQMQTGYGLAQDFDILLALVFAVAFWLLISP